MKKIALLMVLALCSVFLFACVIQPQPSEQDDYDLEKEYNDFVDAFGSKETDDEDKPAASGEYVDAPEVTPTPSTTPAPTTTPVPTTTKGSGLSPDFKAAMDSYENFMDEYVAFMKKYQKNPSNLALLADYAKFMNKYAKWAEDFEKWQDEEMNAAETAYYIDVQARVSKKLLEIA